MTLRDLFLATPNPDLLVGLRINLSVKDGEIVRSELATPDDVSEIEGQS